MTDDVGAEVSAPVTVASAHSVIAGSDPRLTRPGKALPANPERPTTSPTVPQHVYPLPPGMPRDMEPWPSGTHGAVARLRSTQYPTWMHHVQWLMLATGGSPRDFHHLTGRLQGPPLARS